MTTNEEYTARGRLSEASQSTASQPRSGSFRQIANLPDDRFHQQSVRIQVTHSTGQPRTTLNKLLVENIKHLGILSNFVQSASCTKNGQISHFVLTIKWNSFASSRSENQQIYIRAGPMTEKTAEVIAKTKRNIPIFYDPKQDICVHYTGHYKPLSSSVKRLDPPFVFSRKVRCMYIEIWSLVATIRHWWLLQFATETTGSGGRVDSFGVGVQRTTDLMHYCFPRHRI